MAPTRSRPGASSLSPLARFWTTTHAPEYVGLTLLIVGWILIVLLVTPFHRLFFIDDVQISFPYAEHERVSVPMNFVYALFIPLGVLIAVNLATRSSGTKHEATYLSFLIAVTMSAFLTDIIKNAVGRPRPDLLARCQPSADAPRDRPVDIAVCTTDPAGHVLQDGWRSFPSGHSSFSFAGLGFTALFFAGQLRVFRPDGGRDLSRSFVCLAPLVGAALIAISRCEDYRHDVYDVCFGSALGMVVAFWSYRRHWPALSSPRCSEPYPHPAAAATDSPQGWQRVRDEEEAGTTVGYEMVSPTTLMRS